MPALVVASAGKPSEARYFAEPTSNGFGMTKQPGARCSSAKRARFWAIVRLMDVPPDASASVDARQSLGFCICQTRLARTAGHSLATIE